LSQDDYVKRPEPLFEWHDTGARVGNATSGFIGYVLNFTSQQWLTAADSSQPIWTHQLVVIVPTNYDPTSTALLYIGGGENPGQPIKPLDEVCCSLLPV
jgi:PhoPQ-activated pathogenicity-related protein